MIRLLAVQVDQMWSFMSKAYSSVVEEGSMDACYWHMTSMFHWCPGNWSKFKMPSFPCPRLKEILQDFCNTNSFLKDMSLDWMCRIFEINGKLLQSVGICPHGLAFCSGFLLASPQWVCGDAKETTMPLEMISKYSVHWCNWQKSQTAAPGAGFSFHTSTFQMTTSMITRSCSKFLALEGPTIPVGIKKAGLLLSLENVLTRHCPKAQMRKIRNLFWLLKKLSLT